MFLPKSGVNGTDQWLLSRLWGSERVLHQHRNAHSRWECNRLVTLQIQARIHKTGRSFGSVSLGQLSFSRISNRALWNKPVFPLFSCVSRTRPSCRGLCTRTSSPSRKCSSESVCAAYAAITLYLKTYRQVNTITQSRVSSQCSKTQTHIHTYSAFRKYSDPLFHILLCCSLMLKWFQFVFYLINLHSIPYNDIAKTEF